MNEAVDQISDEFTHLGTLGNSTAGNHPVVPSHLWSQFTDELVILDDSTNGICEVCGDEARVTVLVPYFECADCAKDWDSVCSGTIPILPSSPDVQEENEESSFYSFTALSSD